jgi:hypothetical protein
LRIYANFKEVRKIYTPLMTTKGKIASEPRNNMGKKVINYECCSGFEGPL